MPKNPTFEQKVEWHTEHNKNCNCRPGFPEKLKEKMVKKGVKIEFLQFARNKFLSIQPMHINAQYSAESSNLSEKLIFLCERYDLTREDIKELKSKKLLKFINEDDLPKAIPCQVIVHCETYRKAKLTFFNPRFNLPLEVYNEPFLNKDIIESSKRNGGFWLEFSIPLSDSGVNLSFNFEC